MAKGVNYAPWEKAFDRILTPLEEFIHRQTTAGILLMVCAVIALIIGNSGIFPAYDAFLHTKISIGWGDGKFALSIHHWINELLMALFFMLIGLELKRELLVGELSSPKQALLPIMAALGGMALPALGYMLVAGSGSAADGWGIPMATDIAFAVGALSLLGSRVPKSLITFLIALAIVDDLGAVIVIALFYTAEINTFALMLAAGATLALIGLNSIGVRTFLPYAFIGLLLWSAMLSSGIHATIAGVILAFTVPIRPKFEPEHFLNRISDKAERMRTSVERNPDIIHNSEFRGLVSAMGDGVSLVQAPAQRAEHALHTPVTYLIIPLFALANAGIPIDFANFGATLSHEITLGVIVGLLLGKPLGVFLLTWLTVKLGLAELPEDMRMSHVLGVGLLAGIGFTMAIFIGDLAFINNATELLQAKTGILFASLAAGLMGFFLLRAIGTPPDQG